MTYKLLENETFPQLEARIAKFWEENNIFQRSVDETNGGEFVFYDGPPFANGLPHYGHLLTSFIKDIYARYQTMQGLKTERRFGWDCHGLPAEMEVEKQLGIQGRVDITEYGIGKFNDECEKSVMKYAANWEDYITKAGRWVDFENDYKTMDISYMESVIWAFKELHNKGLVYEDYRVMPYSWKAETPLSNFETRMDNAYREKSSKAVTVKFELTSGKFAGHKILVWTTTPWTLPSNLMLAVGKDIEYTVIQKDGENLIIAKNLVSKYAKELGEVQNNHCFLGEELIGESYKPLFPYFQNHTNAFKILHGDFVTTEDGTGIVHMAPGFGEDDWDLCKKNGISIVCPVDEKGRFTAEIFDINEQNHKTLPRKTIECPNLYTEEITHSHFDLIKKLYQDKEVRHFYDKQSLTDDEIKQEIDLYISLRQKFGHARFAIFEKSTKEFVGVAGIDNVTINSSEKQYGITLHKKFWGKGYGTEIGKALIQTLGVNEISAYVKDENTASTKMLEKLGFKNRGKKVYERTGATRTHYVLDTGILSLASRQVFETNDDIIRHLKKQNSWLKTEQYLHNYPHCWRTDTPLIYKAVPSWYVEVTKFRDQMVEVNKSINWIPSHIKDGLFGKWIENARDWSISRNRFWGCPVPVWKTSQTRADLKNHNDFENYEDYKSEYFGFERINNNFKSIEFNDIESAIAYIDEIANKNSNCKPFLIRFSSHKDRITNEGIELGGGLATICKNFEDLKTQFTEYATQNPDSFPFSFSFLQSQYFFGSIKEMEEFFGDYYIQQHKQGKNSGHYIQADGSFKITNLHRPFIDELTAPDPLNPSHTIKRVEDVLDCWFESGSMPFASVHYPFALTGKNGEVIRSETENKKWFEEHFPADFIVEYSAQTRGWFYTLVVLGTALFGKAPFKNCICHGVILDENGNKLSKRLRNYPDPLEVFNSIGSDAMRYFVVSSPVVMGGELYIPRTSQGIQEIVRLVIKPIWNAYTFFAMYANADKITAEKSYSSTNQFDLYIFSELHHFVRDFTNSMNDYNTQTACKLIADFLDILNNWYIRRNKERFWKHEHDTDKTNAYNTLYTVILDFITTVSPILPFTSEGIFQFIVNYNE